MTAAVTGDSRYYAQPRPDILALVPPDAVDVLDCGCGEGALGARLVERGHRVTGIEVDEAAAAVAATRLQRTITGRVEEVVHTLPADAFDCIVCADVLEHLVDPWSAASALARRLKPSGVFVCSVPNVRHLGVIVDLLVRGRWAYADSGVLDRTHVRFFTRASARELLEGAGLSVRTLAGNRERYRGALAVAATAASWFAPDLCVAQWVATAARREV